MNAGVSTSHLCDLLKRVTRVAVYRLLHSRDSISTPMTATQEDKSTESPGSRSDELTVLLILQKDLRHREVTDLLHEGK